MTKEESVIFFTVGKDGEFQKYIGTMTADEAEICAEFLKQNFPALERLSEFFSKAAEMVRE